RLRGDPVVRVGRSAGRCAPGTVASARAAGEAVRCRMPVYRILRVGAVIAGMLDGGCQMCADNPPPMPVDRSMLEGVRVQQDGCDAACRTDAGAPDAGALLCTLHDTGATQFELRCTPTMTVLFESLDIFLDPKACVAFCGDATGCDVAVAAPE